MWKESLGKPRMCMAEASGPQSEAMKSKGGEGPAVAPPGGLMGPQKLVQYWVKQSDGSYSWSPWMPRVSLKAYQTELSLRCPECGEPLLKQRRSPFRSKKVD